jgi:hypothetical protein
VLSASQELVELVTETGGDGVDIMDGGGVGADRTPAAIPAEIAETRSAWRLAGDPSPVAAGLSRRFA